MSIKPYPDLIVVTRLMTWPEFQEKLEDAFGRTFVWGEITRWKIEHPAWTTPYSRDVVISEEILGAYGVYLSRVKALETKPQLEKLDNARIAVDLIERDLADQRELQRQKELKITKYALLTIAGFCGALWGVTTLFSYFSPDQT